MGKESTSSPSLSPTWFCEKYEARNGGSDCLELSPGSLCCGYAIGSDGSEIRHQMKKLSRRENQWEKMKKMRMMILMDREMKKK